jgi:CBS domain-containing protein
MTTTVRQMLRGKPDVHAVGPDSTVFDALGLMAAHNIGAVLVVADDKLLGILSERDYARKGILLGRASRDTRVADLMTSPVICVDPSFTADACMALMTEKRVRHLPVMEHGRVVGVISIGDVVRAVVEEQRFTIDALQHYISTS